MIEASSHDANKVNQALQADSTLATEFANRREIRREDLPAILSLYHLLYRELVGRAGGNPIDNRDTVYHVYSLAKDLNDSVSRYSASEEAPEYVLKNYTPTGVVEDPVLAVHTTYDHGVPPRLPSYYDVTVSLRSNEKLFVRKHVDADGHCNIAPDLMGRAFDELRCWAATGVRPDSGTLRP